MSNPSVIPPHLQPFFDQVKLPKKDSHKGQNGKLLIIGGSELFHAASAWSLDVASKFVDMVFYSSVPSNNELIQAAKQHFWNGIVVPRAEVESYLEEADAILIGPGMTRTPDTAQLVNQLLTDWPAKNWVIDAGALQMVEPDLLTEHCLLTPHKHELVQLAKKSGHQAVLELLFTLDFSEEQAQLSAQKLAQELSTSFGGATVLLTGTTDMVSTSSETEFIVGGNPGMTKGGSGDVLAGLVAALYTQHSALASAVVGSTINKLAGDELYQTVGPFFNSSDLVSQVPKTAWQVLN